MRLVRPSYLLRILDKLLNYIRFWQADGESVKTSVRTRTSLGQMVEDGHFKGGLAAYGYDLSKSGRLNKRKHELLDLTVNETEAPVVRLIFDKYVNEGYGAQRITTFLNTNGYRTRTGKMWHPASIHGILCNLTYTGVLRSGESRSPILPELQIISQEQFEKAQQIRKERSAAAQSIPHVPINTRGQSLLSGNVFCGHCGARLTLTTSQRYRKLRDGSYDKTPRIRYVCYGKTRKQTEFTGQTGYTLHILNDLIDNIMQSIFSRMQGIPKSELVSSRYEKELMENIAHLKGLKADQKKHDANVKSLKEEVIRCIQGQSAFSQNTLAELIRDAEEKGQTLQIAVSQLEATVEDKAKTLDELSSQFDELLSWADLYNSSSFEAKKMIVNRMIERVDVQKDYKLHVSFRFDMNQFYYGA